MFRQTSSGRCSGRKGSPEAWGKILALAAQSTANFPLHSVDFRQVKHCVAGQHQVLLQVSSRSAYLVAFLSSSIQSKAGGAIRNG